MLIDGIIYVCIGVLTFLTTQLGTDEAAKYIGPESLYYMRLSAGGVMSGFLALKMFRSETYSNWKRDKANGNGKHLPTELSKGNT